MLIVVLFHTQLPHALSMLVTAVQCPTPGAGENSYMTGADSMNGDTVTYHCMPGYETDTGDAARTCQADATWNGVPLNCKRT